MGEDPVFAGKLALYWSVPLVLHAADVTGHPVRVGLAARAQVEAFETVHESVSLPPDELSEGDAALKEPIDGFDAAVHPMAVSRAPALGLPRPVAMS